MVGQAMVFEKDDVFDPAIEPELLAGVLSKRVLAFFVDVVVLGVIELAAVLIVFLMGLFTFGLAWLVFALPFFATVAVLYVALTMGGSKAATPGMQLVGVTIRNLDGSRTGYVVAGAHVILYWVLISLLTPLVLIVGLMSNRKRLLHDMLLGTIVVNAEPLRRVLR